jgi:hypothetical protein
MKKNLSILFFLVFTVQAINSQNKHLGTWESLNTDDPVIMILDDKGYMTFRVENLLLGGIGYNISGERLRMTYRINYTPKLPKITVVIKDLNENKVSKKDVGSIQFKSSNIMEMCFRKTIQDNSNKTNKYESDCKTFLKIK